MILKSKRVYLRPVSKNDAEMMLRWRNASHVAKNSYSQRRIGPAEHAKWMCSTLKDKTRLTYIIVLNKDRKPIGKIGLKNIDLSNKRAELEKLIGEADYRNKGYATEASALFLSYMFKKLGFKRIYAHVLEFNRANIQVNKKLGFKVEGRLRNHFFNKGKFIDVLYMGLLEEEFLKKEARL